MDDAIHGKGEPNTTLLMRRPSSGAVLTETTEGDKSYSKIRFIVLRINLADRQLRRDQVHIRRELAYAHIRQRKYPMPVLQALVI